MLSCREATALVSKGLDTRLSLRERLGLLLHVRMCAHCTRYRRQLSLLREMLRRGIEDLPEYAVSRFFSLTAADRERLNRTMNVET